MTWKFKELDPGLVEIDLYIEELFNNDDTNIENTLVRETIQNSLDACYDSDEPVEVRFDFLGSEDRGPVVAGLWDGLIQHLDLAGVETARMDFTRPAFLVIEDLNTTGLLGPVDGSDKQSDWYGFFWRLGKSHKKGVAGGRRGLGRNVFAIVSEAHSFIVTTRRRNDEEREFMMGFAPIGSHSEGATDYFPIGHFGLHASDKRSLPIESQARIEEVKGKLNLNRKTKAGLSIIIPFPISDITPDRLFSNAVSNYMVSIWINELVVEVAGQRVSRENLKNWMQKLDAVGATNKEAMLDFVDEWFTCPESQIVQIKIESPQPDHLRKEYFAEDIIKELRKQFSKGECVIIDVPVTVQKKDVPSVTCKARLAVMKTPDGASGRDFYRRGNMPVLGEQKFGNAPAFGIFNASAEELVEMLGDAEGAAHWNWNSRHPDLKKKYKSYTNAILFCKRALKDFYDLLVEAEEGEDPYSFAVYFPIIELGGSTFGATDAGAGESNFVDEDPDEEEEPEPEDEEEEEDIDEMDEDEDEDTITDDEFSPVPPPSYPVYLIKKQTDGFRVVASNGATASDFPAKIELIVAHDIKGRSPYKAYSLSDFTFTGHRLKIKGRGVKVNYKKNNKLVFTARDIGFSLRVSGFDENRDIIINDVLVGAQK